MGNEAIDVQDNKLPIILTLIPSLFLQMSFTQYLLHGFQTPETRVDKGTYICTFR